jgi:hypothetical protein
MAAPPAACLDGLPRDCWLRVLQAASGSGGAAVLAPSDLAALLVATCCCAPAVTETAAARTVALLGAAAGFNARHSAAQAVLRLALAQRIEADIRGAGFAAPALAVRTTLVHKATGRVSSYGEAAVVGRQPVARDRISACSNRDSLSLVICEPAVVYVFGWHHGNFVWHERKYAALPLSPSSPPTATAAAENTAAAVPATPLVVVPVAAAAPPLPSGEGELPLEERVALHLRRVRYYIAHRNQAMMTAQ